MISKISYWLNPTLLARVKKQSQFGVFCQGTLQFHSGHRWACNPSHGMTVLSLSSKQFEAKSRKARRTCEKSSICGTGYVKIIEVDRK